jgi:hypothetical protein
VWNPPLVAMDVDRAIEPGQPKLFHARDATRWWSAECATIAPCTTR